MSSTLIEQAKVALEEGNVLQATVMETYARNSDLLLHLPFMSMPGYTLVFNRDVPSPVDPPILNTSKSKDNIERVCESLHIAGSDIDVDSFLIATSPPNGKMVHMMQKVKVQSLQLTDRLINEDYIQGPAMPLGFEGLKSRCIGQQIVNCDTNLSLEKLDELIGTVNNPTHLLMSKSMCEKLCATNKYITHSTDVFNREIAHYRNLTIMLAGKNALFAEILPFGNDGTSIYCLSLCDGKGIVGLQHKEMLVRDLGEIDEKPVHRVRIEWYIGLILIHKKAIARLRHIKNGPVRI